MFNIDYLFDSTRFNGVVLLLDNNLKVLKVNDYFLTLQGYARDEVVNNSILNFILPTDKSIFFDIAYSTAVSKEFISQMYHKNGAFRFLSFTVIKFKEYSILFGSPEKKEFTSYHYDNTVKPTLENQCILTSVLDITDIFRGNQTLGCFIDVFPSDVWVKDKLGRYVYVNSAFTAHTGHTLLDIKGKDDYEIFPKKVALEFATSDKIAIKNKQKIDYTFEVKDEKLLTWTAVSKIPLYNKNKTLIGILGYSVDVSEFKQIEQKQKGLINSYKRSINTYFDIAFSYSNKGIVGSIFGKEITENNLGDYKVEISRVFNLVENKSLKNDIEELKNQNIITVNLNVFDKLYSFSFVSIELNQEYNIYVMGKRAEE
jgi:PAS domain S-box-containing protein